MQRPRWTIQVAAQTYAHIVQFWLRFPTFQTVKQAAGPLCSIRLYCTSMDNADSSNGTSNSASLCLEHRRSGLPVSCRLARKTSHIQARHSKLNPQQPPKAHQERHSHRVGLDAKSSDQSARAIACPCLSTNAETLLQWIAIGYALSAAAAASVMQQRPCNVAGLPVLGYLHQNLPCHLLRLCPLPALPGLPPKASAGPGMALPQKPHAI